MGGRKVIDVTGQAFGRLTVIRRAGFSRSGEVTWLCVCGCGGKSVVTGGNLRAGNTGSCGCHKLEVLRARSTTHGHTKGGQWSPEYRTWAAIMGCCHNPNHTKYRFYGGRGRKVFKPWRKAETFISYLLEHLGPKPAGLTLERIDKSLGYCPGNIRWAVNKGRPRRQRATASA
jgi:hypothetical protein